MSRIVAYTAFIVLLFVACASPPEAADDLGTIDFPNSGAAEAQEAFERGVLLLHSFEFEDSLEAFEEALEIDPDFYLAYWGAAMTHNHPLWAQQDMEAAQAILTNVAATPDERLEKAPDARERGYFEALEILYGWGGSDDLGKKERDVAFSAAMARLSRAYPEDLEAKAFYSLSILGSISERDFATYMRAAAVAEEVFAANPRHPGAVHYLIHSYDDPVHAPLGLRAARVYADIAPAATHAQHMISHIYTALGSWDDVITANQKSFQVSEERLKRKGLPDHERTKHSLYWLEYGLLQAGRFDEAVETLEIIAADTAASTTRQHLWHYAKMRATHLVADPASGDALPPLDLSSASIDAVAADALASVMQALARDDMSAAHAAGESLASALAEVEITSSDEGLNVYDGAVSEEDLQVARITGREIEALILHAEGETERAIAILEPAAVETAQRALEYGPPSIVKPTYELLGELLLAAGRPEEAQTQFEAALVRAPRRTLSLMGLARAAEAAGDAAAASEARATLAEFWQGDADAQRAASLVQ